MKKFRMIAMALLLFALLTVPVSAMQEDSTQSQLEAYGTVELFDDRRRKRARFLKSLALRRSILTRCFRHRRVPLWRCF